LTILVVYHYQVSALKMELASDRPTVSFGAQVRLNSLIWLSSNMHSHIHACPMHPYIHACPMHSHMHACVIVLLHQVFVNIIV